MQCHSCIPVFLCHFTQLQFVWDLSVLQVQPFVFFQRLRLKIVKCFDTTDQTSRRWLCTECTWRLSASCGWKINQLLPVSLFSHFDLNAPLFDIPEKSHVWESFKNSLKENIKGELQPDWLSPSLNARHFSCIRLPHTRVPRQVMIWIILDDGIISYHRVLEYILVTTVVEITFTFF